MRTLVNLDGTYEQDETEARHGPLLSVVSSQPQADILAQLSTVFSRWPAADAYAYYLLNLPNLNLGLVDRNVSDAPAIIAAGSKEWMPYDLGTNNAKIHLSIPPAMRSLPPRYQICVALDSLGVVVPSALGEIVSASFTTGLVCRLVLKKFGDRSTQNFLDELDLLSANAAEFTTGYQTTPAQFLSRIADLGRRRPIQASGFFVGWNAGGDVTSADAPVMAAVWALIKGRFPPGQIAEMASYGINYALGFLRTQDVLQAANTAQNAGQIFDPNVILSKLQGDPEIGNLVETSSQFFDALISALHQAARGNPAAYSGFSEFMRGYQRGTIHAAEDIFVAVLRVAYGIGYSDGFRVGYARGYSDGYKAGYRAGRRTNWSSVLHDVADVARAVVAVAEICA